MPRDVDLWASLRPSTPARVGLARRGDAPTMGDVLDFQLAHARARDAVHAGLDVDAIAAELSPRATIRVASAAVDLGTYLRRPDLGRKLDAASVERLNPTGADLVVVIGDGLSAAAVQGRAVPFLNVALDRLGAFSLAPIVIATRARVALGDEIGERLQASMCIMLIGERPGLSIADSLGVYLTYAPKVGRTDAARNCISNIHAAGLSYDEAADKLAWLVREGLRRGVTGVALKDEAAAPVLLKGEPSHT